MTDDKFILMNMDDERAKKVAEVIGNATCKKMIDYLAETKEASEKDISDALNIPINTIEYNLKKLINAGLVEKTKNFFWSVKGKRIEMFKLAKKHIVISPKSKRPDMNLLKTLVPVVLIALALVALIAFIPHNPVTDNQTQLKQFTSYDELKNFLKDNAGATGYYYGASEMMNKGVGIAPSAATSVDSAGGEAAQDFSTTNIQVEGVDEADIVKNDGKYIYVVSGNKVDIVNAYPAENMKIISEIDLKEDVGQIFINGDKLIVFASGYEYVPYTETQCLANYGYGGCGGNSAYKSLVYIYNIEDKENPVLEQNISADGNYVDSRMIGDYVYVISNKYVNTVNPEPPVYIMNGVEKQVAVGDIYYWPYPDDSYVFTSIMAVDVNNGEFNSEVYLTGYTGTIYVSQDNIYLTRQKRIDSKDYNELLFGVYSDILPLLEREKVEKIMDSDKSSYEKQAEIGNIIKDYSDSLTGNAKSEFDQNLVKALEDFQAKIAKESEKTVINKININEKNIEYKGAGEVPGNVLNQFSMDEYEGYFRVATTTGEIWSGNSLNHLYVLDGDLKIVGKVEDLAHGEKIYSTRFLGERAYIVTFKKVDPLFVIDLKTPEDPKVLGYLKITGFSDYLHPYDENHIIGVGKEAVAASDTEVGSRNLDFAWYQGLKISLFDVSDVANPVEEAKIVIGDRGTDSSALYDHKAFLFDKEKKLLVIPVTLAEIDRTKYRTCSEDELKSYDSYSYCLTANTYGETVWQGAYVLNIDLNEISVRGKISHSDYSPKYIAAEDEAIGATREIYGQTWEKVRANEWETNSSSYNYGGTKTIWSDSLIDQQPGGIDYKSAIYDYSSQIQRSLYMDNVLYTVSNAKIKANNLQTIENISSVDLGYEGISYDYRYAA